MAWKLPARFIPFLGWALLAYDLYGLYQWYFDASKYNLAGWNKLCTAPPVDAQKIRWANKNPGIPCPTASQIPSGSFGATIPQGVKWVGIGPSRSGGIRMQIREQYSRPDPNPQPIPIGIQAPVPMEDPFYIPWLTPNPLPGQSPLPVPLPYPMLPYQPNWPTPEGPQRGNHPPGDLPASSPGTDPADYPGMTPAPHGIEITLPGSAVPAPGLGPQPVQQPHRRQPPEPGVTERKRFVIRGGIAQRVFGSFGEFHDFVDVIYNHIREQLRPRKINGRYTKESFADGRQFLPYKLGLTNKIAMIKKHWRVIEPSGLLKGLAYNELEDMAYGLAGKALAKAIRNNPYYNRPVGLAFGPLH